MIALNHFSHYFSNTIISHRFLGCRLFAIQTQDRRVTFGRIRSQQHQRARVLERESDCKCLVSRLYTCYSPRNWSGRKRIRLHRALVKSRTNTASCRRFERHLSLGRSRCSLSHGQILGSRFSCTVSLLMMFELGVHCCSGF